MIDHQTALDKYNQAFDALTEIIDDPAATGADRTRAQRMADQLTLDFIRQRMDSIEARSAQFAEFIRRMEEVIAATSRDPILSGIKKLKGIVDKSKELIDLGTALVGDQPAPPAEPGVPGPAGARRPTSGRAKGKDDSPSYPNTTRPEAKDRREAPPRVTAAQVIEKKIGAKLDAQPDRIDPRDWFYEPTLEALPDVVVNVDPAAVLDQGTEGACTGFALAAVINHLLKARGNRKRVSERMLYEMARRYDEWPGEGYEGSSARGAIKGWVAHGVCDQKSWPKEKQGVQHFSEDLAVKARAFPGGAYYRVMHREVRDMHAAINEVGILYCTLMVHQGWADPAGETRTIKAPGARQGFKVPIIRRVGRATDGHAIAIVGYNEEGFIIQNSWGGKWGNRGFALLPYEDFLIHATDVWVAQLGVPISLDLWDAETGADVNSGLHRASQAIPLDAIRPYVINVGNNGELSDNGEYWTTEADVERLFNETIPDQTKGWDKKRILLYLHGGLNPEAAVAKRIVAFKNVLLENQIYPLHIMWETGAMESIKNIIKNVFTDTDERAGGIRDWVNKMREGLVEAKDRTFEFTVALPGTALWDEMKRNARLASDHRVGRGAMQIVESHVREAMKKVKDKNKWELHVVAHSAGSIFAAYAMQLLTNPEIGIALKTLQFMAPAITTDLFKSRILPHVRDGRCPQPANFILSDVGERDDTVGPYGKSLLFLVSNAFEGRRETPLLGMQRYVSDSDPEVGGRFADPDLNAIFKQNAADGLQSLVVAGKGPRADPEADPAAWGIVSRSETHGGFDNDQETMNSVLYRILGGAPKKNRWFTVDDLRY